MSLKDFEAYLEAEFDPSRFANDLVLAINDPDEAELDLLTAVKRLKFDIDECEKRMASISALHHEVLIDNFSKIEAKRKVMEADISPLIHQVNILFDRIRDNVIDPYNQALRMNGAMKRIHATLLLFRGCSYFIFLVQQLEEAANAENRDPVRLARLHSQLSEFYSSAHSENLLLVKLVRNYQQVYTSKRQAFINDISLQATQDFAHKLTFAQNNTTLQANLVALYTLGEKEFTSLVERAAINKHIQQASTQLTRSLQLPRTFNTALADIKSDADEFLTRLTDLLSTPADDTTLLAVITAKEPLAVAYWTELAYRFKKSIAATMARGGAIAKNLRIYKEGVSKSVGELFAPEEAALLQDAIDIIA